jgi:hypothetical protein
MNGKDLSSRIASRSDAEKFAKAFLVPRIPVTGEEVVSRYSTRLAASICHLESPDPETESQYRLRIFRVENQNA